MFGPFCTGIFLFLALWGTVFMAVLGGLFYNQSGKDWKTRVNNFNSLYQQNAYNCWVACGVYIGIAVLLSVRACCLAKRA
ncbi:unnamed protein product [Caenorhabditis sp. 36 PRJEB53466]|nr:unnamed protein product [Caenorhabditis sp. 36 PRJEB53466]